MARIVYPIFWIAHSSEVVIAQTGWGKDRFTRMDGGSAGVRVNRGRSVFCQLLAEMFFNAVVGQENVCTPATSHWASSQASPSVEATVVVSGETRSVDTISVSVIPSWLTVTDTV